MKLDPDRIVDAAMEVFAQVGYDGLSMRRVAARLNAQAGSLYYHVRSKDELVRLMAEKVVRECFDAGTKALAELGPQAGWLDQVQAQLVALRAVLLPRPGGALLLARSPGVLSESSLALMNRLIEVLQTAGIATPGLVGDTLLGYLTGFVLQEQSVAADLPVDPVAVQALLRRYPLIAGAEDPDAQFAGGIRLICAGARSPESAERGEPPAP